MKVKELIKELEKENPESEAVYGDSFWAEITSVKEENDGIQASVVVIN